MAVDAFTGPIITFGRANALSTTYAADYNPQMGPSLFFQGAGIIDDRRAYCYQPGQNSSEPIYGWYGTDRVVTVNQTPTTAAENSIAATQSATTAGAARTLTLNTTNGANTTVNVSITAPETGRTVTGLMAIDTATATITFGSDASVNVWSPATTLARCVRIEGSSDDSGGVFTVSGRDVYGYLMNEVVVGSISTTAGSTFVVTQKAFKYISTITCSGVINSTGVTVGVADIYGFPIAVTNPSQVLIGISSGTQFSTVTASTGIIVASTVATQTSTTPDVRGTWSSTTAADGTRIYFITQSINPAALNSTGLYGAAQYSTG